MIMHGKFLLIVCIVLAGPCSLSGQVHPWVADQGDGTYKNPVLHSDFSDPDVIRVGDDYYMTASSFNCVPGLPILHSRDLVNWTIISYAVPRQYPDSVFSKPQHGNGIWAPSFRFHDGKYWIFYGDPDFGIYMTQANNPRGPWTKPHLVQAGKGWIDPSPLWDDDGRAYLVHAWAGSRASIKSVLIVHEMSPDGKELLDNGVLVFDGHDGNGTVEGPKFYKRDGYYYVLAPAGGVSTGWQLALRSKSIYGPYEVKRVMHQGNTDINGPHQGGWVETQTGEHWFVHFQDMEAYGRVVHLNPVTMEDGWPMMGVDINDDGVGEPVRTFQKPDVGSSYPIKTPQASDEFNDPEWGLQWQWHANPHPKWGFPSTLGFLRLNCIQVPENSTSLWQVPNLLLQKIPAEQMSATTKVKFKPSMNGDRFGLVVMGDDYAHISFAYQDSTLFLQQVSCKGARLGGKEQVHEQLEIESGEFYLRVTIRSGAMCEFYYSLDGEDFNPLGITFQAVPGRWIGAKVGFFCTSTQRINDSGYADIDWFRVE